MDHRSGTNGRGSSSKVRTSRSFLRALISVATGGRIGFARCFAGSFARLLCALREDVERNLVESIAKRPRQSLSNVTGDSRKSIVQPLFSVSCRRKSRSDPAYVHPGRSLSPMKNTEGPAKRNRSTLLLRREFH